MNNSKTNTADNVTVFVVDDEPMLLDLAEAVLASIGCTVKTFRSPEQALQEFTVLWPEVVVTDYAMGRMSGMDLIRECRRHKPGQKLVLVSGTVDEHVFAEAAVKPNFFLAKPYQIQEFVDCVRGLITEQQV